MRSGRCTGYAANCVTSCGPAFDREPGAAVVTRWRALKAPQRAEAIPQGLPTATFTMPDWCPACGCPIGAVRRGGQMYTLDADGGRVRAQADPCGHLVELDRRNP